jgi:hypothetical protein
MLLFIDIKHYLGARTITSGKILLNLYRKQPMKEDKGPTPDARPHWVKQELDCLQKNLKPNEYGAKNDATTVANFDEEYRIPQMSLGL